MSTLTKLINIMRKEPTIPAPRVPEYSLVVLSWKDRVMARVPMEVRVSGLTDWPVVELNNKEAAALLAPGEASYCVLKRDGEPIAFMRAEELFNVVTMDPDDTIDTVNLRITIGTTAMRVVL